MGVVVRQKKKGRGQPWWVFISHDGKRTSRKVGDKAAAEKVASTIRAKLQLGEFNLDTEKKSVPTFKEYSKRYMDTYSAMNHKESTIESIETGLRLYMLPEFGKMRIDEIRRKHVKNFITKLHQQGRGTATIRNQKAYFSSILSQAIEDEIIEANPASKTGKLIKKDQKEEIRPFTWEEKTLFEEAVKVYCPELYPFFLTALRTGVRMGELIALKPGDLDFNRGFIDVRRSCVRGRITTPKSGKSRPVDMSKQLQEVLRKYLVDRKKEALKKGWGETPEWLFYNEVGGLIDINNLRKRVFYKVLEKARIRKIRLHDLRHTYASLRVAKGDNLQDVSKQLGHHSVKFTLDVYSHWLPGSNKNQVDELDLKEHPSAPYTHPTSFEKEKGLAETQLSP